MQYQRHIMIGLVLSSLTLADSALAQTDCAAIENARERLACYDAENPPQPGTQSPKIRNEPIRPPSTLGQTPSEPATQPGQSSSPSSSPRRAPGMLDWQEPTNFTTTIAALRRGDQQRMVFRLENGEIWMQNSPRDLPFKVGDEVTIKSGRLGGHIMRSSRGTSTRIRRVN